MRTAILVGAGLVAIVALGAGSLAGRRVAVVRPERRPLVQKVVANGRVVP